MRTNLGATCMKIRDKKMFSVFGPPDSTILGFKKRFKGQILRAPKAQDELKTLAKDVKSQDIANESSAAQRTHSFDLAGNVLVKTNS